KVVGGMDHEIHEANKIADDETRYLSLSAASLHKSDAILRLCRRGRLWYDTFYNAIFTDWDGTQDESVIEPRRITDAWILECYSWLMTQDVKLSSMSRSKAEEAVIMFAHRDERCAPREWLEGLKWDGIERLPTWLNKTYGVPAGDSYYSDVGR